MLPGLARHALVTVGAKEAATFAGLDGVAVTVRMIETADAPAERPGFTVLPARGPFTADGERALFAERGIDAVVAKNAGGAGAAAKLAAARAAGLPVVMIARPPPAPGPTVGDVPAALDWLAARLPGRLASGR